MIGVDGDPQTVPNMLELDSGRWLRGGNEVVLGRTLAKDKGLHVGDTLRMNGSTFSVVGVGTLRGFSSFGQNSVAYMDDRTLVQRAQVGNVLNVIAIQTDQPTRVIERLDDLGGLASWTPHPTRQRSRASQRERHRHRLGLDHPDAGCRRAVREYDAQPLGHGAAGGIRGLAVRSVFRQVDRVDVGLESLRSSPSLLGLVAVGISSSSSAPSSMPRWRRNTASTRCSAPIRRCSRSPRASRGAGHGLGSCRPAKPRRSILLKSCGVLYGNNRAAAQYPGPI